MNIELILFFWLAFWLVFAAIAMIIARNTIHSVLWLILAFFSAAFLWLLLESEFLAMTLILVYVGAIMVLFLFVVMMLNIDESQRRVRFTAYLPLGLLIALLIVIEMILVLSPSQFGLQAFAVPKLHAFDYSNISELALELYTIYIYPFELASVILLIAIISAITLAHREGTQRLRQDVKEQIAVKASQRLHIIKDNPND